MKIIANSKIECEISEAQIRDIAKDHFLKKTGWNENYYINHFGKLVLCVHAHTTHSFTYDDYVREATKEDYQIYLTFLKLFS